MELTYSTVTYDKKGRLVETTEKAMDIVVDPNGRVLGYRAANFDGVRFLADCVKMRTREEAWSRVERMDFEYIREQIQKGQPQYDLSTISEQDLRSMVKELIDEVYLDEGLGEINPLLFIKNIEGTPYIITGALYNNREELTPGKEYEFTVMLTDLDIDNPRWDKD